MRRWQPIHVTCRALPRVGNLRCQLVYAAIRVATLVAAKRDDFRIVHASIQRSHHARALATPREVRNCIAYVLNNWRHHGEHRARDAAQWRVDKYSSAVAFDGWAELGAGARVTAPAGYAPLATRPPRSWLLATGWRRRGLVHLDEVPGSADQRANSSPKNVFIAVHERASATGS